MNQHLSSMLEHFSALRRKNSETTQVLSSSEKIAPAMPKDEHKNLSNIESVGSKTKIIFKDLISDNANKNTILQNCTNFIKCSSAIYNINASISGASNETCTQHKMDNHDYVFDSKEKLEPISNLLENKLSTSIVQGSEQIHNGNTSDKKRNSIAPKNDSNSLQELIPSPRSQRKSSLRIFLDETTGKSSNHMMRPLKTRNILTKNETFDTLYYRAMDVSMKKRTFVYHVRF